MTLDRLLVIVTLTLAACGGATAPARKPEPAPDPVPHTAGPACADAAAHMMQVAGSEDAKLADVVRVRCGADHWTDEARSCFATMQSEPEANGCANMLTPAQRTALSDASAKLNPAPEAAPAPPAPAAEPASHSRGATKKKPAPKTGDPDGGGE